MSDLFKILLNPKGKFGFWGIIILVVAGAALMVLPGIMLDSKPAAQPMANKQQALSESVYALNSIEKGIAAQISQILSQVQGAGQVMVTVSLEAGPEQSYARDASTVRSNVEEKDAGGGTRVTMETNEKSAVVFAEKQGAALVVKELGPRVQGVLVVAEGAKDPEIKAQLSRAVQTMMNLPAHKVLVLPKGER